MPSTRSNSAGNVTAAFVYHDICSRVKKLESAVAKLQRKLRIRDGGHNGADGSNGQGGVPNVAGANGQDDVTAANDEIRDGALRSDCTFEGDITIDQDCASGTPGEKSQVVVAGRHIKDGQAAVQGEEGDDPVLLYGYDVPSHRIVVSVTGTTTSPSSFSFSMKRRNTFSPLKRYIISELRLSQDHSIVLSHMGIPVSSSATPESLGHSRSSRMLLTFVVI
jgi:hypothetical protein